MSNDEFPPPQSPDGSETGLGDLAAGGEGGAPQPPPIDSTQVMPVTPKLPESSPGVPPPTGADAATPTPGVAGAAVVPTETVPEQPWFKRPGAVATLVTAILLGGGIIALIFLLGRDVDDETGSDLSPEPVSFVLVRNSSAGTPLSTTISASVTVQGASADSYVWIVPGDAVVGEPATRETDATGRTEFRWAPLVDADTDTWASTIEFAEFVLPEGEAPISGLESDCILERDGSTEPLVISAEVRADQVPDSPTGVGNYTFPNVRFRAGDRVQCTLSNRAPAPVPTTVPESTTTIPESTTTLPATTTTVPETTTTEATTTTTTSTTTTTTTTTTTSTTLAPPTDPTLGDFLASRNDLSEARQLLEQTGLLAEIEALTEPYTLFVPDNAAIEELRNDPDGPDLDDDAVVEQLLRAHLSIGEELALADLAGRSEIAVEFGGPQPLDAGDSPPTISGAILFDTDLAVVGGVVHAIDATLDPQP